MGTLSVTVNTAPIAIYEPSGVAIDDTVQNRTNASFTVIDTVAYTLSQKQVVVVTESDKGTLFVGFIDTIESTRFTGARTEKLHVIKCVDKHWLVEKRIYTGVEMSGRMGGDVVSQMHQSVLASEGITAQYVIDHDYDKTSWSTGTHAGTSGAAGDLELVKAGSVFTKTETTTADFATGTLDSTVVATNNSLQLQSHTAIKMQGIASPAASNNLFSYFKIYNFSAVTAITGDYLEYDIWISTTSPIISGGLDILCSDGYTMRTGDGQGCQDQYAIQGHPTTDLTGFADDKWYHRMITIPAGMNGKTLQTCVMVLEGDTAGQYTFYVRHVYYRRAAGTLVTTIFDSGALQTASQLSQNGYDGTTIKTCTVYDGQGSRKSPTYTNASCTILGNSLVSWGESIPVVPNTSNRQYPPPIQVEISWDNGFSWMQATNHAPFPGLIPGMLTNAQKLAFRQTLNVAGPFPEYTPSLLDCTMTLSPSYGSSKGSSDYYDADKANDASMGAGTLSNVLSNVNGLQLVGMYQNWDAEGLPAQALYNSDTVSVAATSNSTRTLSLRVQNGGDAKLRQNWAGNTWVDFVAEFDVMLPTGNVSALGGLCYRTTYWGNANNSFGYFMGLSNTGISFGKGSNNGTGAWTAIGTQAVFSVTSGDWYHLKIVVSGTSHKLYVNDILYVNAVDASYSTASDVGLRFYNNSSARQSCYFNNFGITTNSGLSGYRQNGGVSISASGVVCNSIIIWEADVPSACILDVQASTNGGGSWVSCINGQPIPGVTAGTNVAGKTLTIKTVMNTGSASYTPTLKSLSWLVVGNYSVTGTRTSAALSCASVSRAGSSSMSWIENVLPNTSLLCQTSTNGSTWNAQTNGAAIPGINSMPDTPTADDFDANHNGNYTSTFWAAGAIATYTWDTVNSRLTVVGGTNSLYVLNTVSAKDKVVTLVLNQSNSGALLLRYTDASNHYYIDLNDSNATNPQTLQVYKRVAGVSTALNVSANIDFHRGEYHTLQASIIGTTIIVLWDGIQVLNFTDASISASGKTGFYNNGGTAYYQSLQVQPQGDNMAAVSVYYRFVLTSTDPLATSQVLDATISVRGQNLLSGSLIPSTSYSYKKVHQNLDDAAKRSGYWWEIRGSELVFKSRPAELAPWPLSSMLKNDGSCDMRLASIPKLTQTSPMYRNRQYVTNAYDVVTITEQKLGNGIAQSWILQGEVVSISALSVNNQSVSLGLWQIDTGADYYWTPLSASFSQDALATPLSDKEVLTITYKGRIPYTAMKESVAQQTILAALDNSTGIVEESEDGQQCDKATADQLAQARIDQYALLSTNWGFTTDRAGLAPGQLLSCFVPEYNLSDADYFITGVKTIIRLRGDGTTLMSYDILSTQGPIIGKWTRLFTNQ